MNFRTTSLARVLAILAIVTGFAVTAPAASAAEECGVSGPTADQYCPPDPPPPTSTTSSSGLPFTGFDIGLASAAAVALLAAGVGLRRAAGATRDA